MRTLTPVISFIKVVSHSRGRDIINDTNTNNNNLNTNSNPNLQQQGSNAQVSGNQPVNQINENSNHNNNTNYNNINYLLDNSLNNYSSADYIVNNNNEEFSESNNNNRNFDTQLDEIFDQLTYAIRNEKQNLKNEKLLFLKEKQKFLDFKNNEKFKLEKEKEQYKENLKIIDGINIKDSDILDLDIGGTQKITTSRNTLIKVKSYFISSILTQD